MIYIINRGHDFKFEVSTLMSMFTSEFSILDNSEVFSYDKIDEKKVSESLMSLEDNSGSPRDLDEDILLINNLICEGDKITSIVEIRKGSDGYQRKSAGL